MVDLIMYNNAYAPIATAGIGGLTLAETHSMWILLASFAMVALVTAVMRIVPVPGPRLQARPSHWASARAKANTCAEPA